MRGRAGSWRWSPALNGQPSAWFGEYSRSEQARAGAEMVDATDFFVAYVAERSYADLFPSATTLLMEARERAAEAGSPTECFDALDDEEIAKLEALLRATVDNWERWLVQRDESKGCGVVEIDKLRRVQRQEDD